MNTQTRLGRFLISRFLITIAIVAVFESLVFLFINRVAFPVVISLIMPHLENLNSLSLGTVILGIIVLLIILILRILSFFFPTMQGLNEALLKQVLEVSRQCDVHGVAHITGGGFDENIPRILQGGQGLEIIEGTWEILPVFQVLEKWGGVAHREMFNIFNMGIGMVLAVDASEADKAISILEAHGEKASVIGRVTSQPGVNIVMA